MLLHMGDIRQRQCQLFAKADAMLVTLRGGYGFLDATVPARLQSYMSSGRPLF